MTGDGPMELLLAAFALLMAYLLASGLTEGRTRGRFTIYTRQRTPIRYWVSIAGIAASLAGGLLAMAAVAAHLV